MLNVKQQDFVNHAYKMFNKDVLTIDELKFLNYPTKGFTSKNIIEQAEEIWNNEVKPKEDLMGKAVAECIQMDIDRGVEPSLD